MTVRKLSFGELVAQTQQLKLDVARKLNVEKLLAQTEQWKSNITNNLSYEQLKARSEQLRDDVTRLATTSATSAREFLTTSKTSLQDRLETSATSAKTTLLWAARTYVLVCFTLFYWLVVVPVTFAYVFVVDTVLSITDVLSEKSDVLRFTSEIVLSLLSALQRCLCWLVAYIRHREKCVKCSTRYLTDNDIEVYGFVVPRNVNGVLLRWFPKVNDFVAPAFDYFLDLLLEIRPDNCGQLDHKNDRYECWVHDEGDKMRVMPTRSNCPVALSSNVHRRIQQQRADLSKLSLNVAKES